MKSLATTPRLVLDTNIVMDMLHFANIHTQPLQAAIAAQRFVCLPMMIALPNSLALPVIPSSASMTMRERR